MRRESPRPMARDEAAHYRALLFSIYYHTDPALLELPEHKTPRLAPLPLEDAVEAMTKAEPEHLRRFRPRVVSRLLLQRNFSLAARLLSKEEYDSLRIALPQLPEQRRVRRQKRVVSGAYDRSEEALFNLVHAVLGESSAPRYVRKWLSIDQYLVATVGIEFESTRSFEDLCNALDPANWSGAFPKFFAASYAVRIARDGTFQEIPTPDPREPWQLFECVQWNWNFMSLSQGNNLLNIGGQAAKTAKLEFDYTLYKCAGTSLGLVQEPGGLDVDRGPLSVIQNADGTGTVMIQKSVRFTNPIINAIAPIVLWLWMDHAVLDALG